MQILKVVFLLVTLMVAASQGTFSTSDGQSPVQTFVQDFKTAASEVKDSVITGKKAVVNKVATLGKHKLHTLKNLKEAQVHAVKSIIDETVETLEAIKAGKVAILKTVAKKVTAPFRGQEAYESFGRPVPRPQTPLLALITGAFGRSPGASHDEQADVEIGEQDFIFVPSAPEVVLETQEALESVVVEEPTMTVQVDAQAPSVETFYPVEAVATTASLNYGEPPSAVDDLQFPDA